LEAPGIGECEPISRPRRIRLLTAPDFCKADHSQIQPGHWAAGTPLRSGGALVWAEKSGAGPAQLPALMQSVATSETCSASSIAASAASSADSPLFSHSLVKPGFCRVVAL
jgi:hypothetical protein